MIQRPVTRRSAAAQAAAAASQSGGGQSKVRDSKRLLDGAGSVESWNGIIATAKDALLIIEACREGILPILMNRPKERERDLIRSGSIIVFMESQSGMKRWRVSNSFGRVSVALCGMFKFVDWTT